MRAMTVLNLASNGFKGAEAGKALGDALAANTVLKELDISGGKYRYQQCDVEFVQAFSVGFRDNGALSVANVMGNKIGKEQLAKLQEIMRAKPSLVSLCGIAYGATEADLSGLGMDADDAIILASELPDKGAMTHLNISNNSIVSMNTVVTKEKTYYEDSDGDAVTDSDEETEEVLDFNGVAALANAVRDMGALASIDLRNNNIPYKQSATIKTTCDNKNITLQL
jgi:hypothetical protein